MLCQDFEYGPNLEMIFGKRIKNKYIRGDDLEQHDGNR